MKKIFSFLKIYSEVVKWLHRFFNRFNDPEILLNISKPRINQWTVNWVLNDMKKQPAVLLKVGIFCILSFTMRCIPEKGQNAPKVAHYNLYLLWEMQSYP